MGHSHAPRVYEGMGGSEYDHDRESVEFGHADNLPARNIAPGLPAETDSDVNSTVEMKMRKGISPTSFRTGANAAEGDDNAITLGVNQDFYKKNTQSFRNEGDANIPRLDGEPDKLNPNYVPEGKVRLISGVLHKETPSQTTDQRDASIPHNFTKTAPRENMGMLHYQKINFNSKSLILYFCFDFQ